MKFSYALIKEILPKAPSAAKIAEALNFHSFEVESVRGDTLEIKLPANIYSYAASHAGIAREIAAIFDLKFSNPARESINIPQDDGLVEVKIADPGICGRYAVRYFENVKVGESPWEMKKILKSCGINSINNVVDATNYAMLVTGQPLHAFDFDKIKSANQKSGTRSPKRIGVRAAKRGEKFEALDDQQYVLAGGEALIVSSGEILALGGIKGGKYSGVSRGTKKILLEGANFAAASVYRASRNLNLITDASVRFAHGISPALVSFGLDLATEILSRAGAELRDSADSYPKKATDEIIPFDPKKFERLIGRPVLLTDAKIIFEKLGFFVETKMKKAEGSLRVRVPSWRNDIGRFEDLAEEAARMLGYNELAPSAPQVSLSPSVQDDSFIFRDKARALLSGYVLDEVYNYSFVGEDEIKSLPFMPVFGHAKPVEIANPASLDKKFMRISLAPILLKNIADNSRYFEEVRIFEIGKVFAEVRGAAAERSAVAVALAGKNNPRVFLELKGIVDQFLGSMGVEEFHFRPDGGMLRIESGKNILGQIAHIALSRGWFAAVAEIDAEKVINLVEEEIRFKPLPKYPSIIRDISFLVDRKFGIGEIMESIENTKPKHLLDIDLLDEYTDPKFEDQQSLTLRFIFQSHARTLSDAEVNREMEAVSSHLRVNFQAQIR